MCFHLPEPLKHKGGSDLGSGYGTDNGPFVSFSDFEGFLKLLLGVTVETGGRAGGDGVPGSGATLR